MFSANNPSAAKNESDLINSESKTEVIKPTKRASKKKKIALRPGSPFSQSEVTGGNTSLKGLDKTLAQLRLGYCQLMTEFIKGDGMDDDAFDEGVNQLDIQITESLRYHLQTSFDKNEPINTPTLEKFYPLIGYFGLSKTLHAVIKFVGLDFHNLVQLYSYATTMHVCALKYDNDATTIEYLYDDLPQSEDFLGELHTHMDLDELLIERRNDLRFFLMVSIKNHLEKGAYSPDFKSALNLIARNHDIEFMEFIFNWIEENKDHPEKANKSEQYLRSIGTKLLDSLEAQEDERDKLFLHLLECIDVDFNKIKIEQNALYVQNGSGKKSYHLLSTTPLHIAVHLGDKLNYDIVVKKTKNLSVKCEATPCDKPTGCKKMPWEVNDLGFTPLHIAIVLDRDPIVKDLINRQADIDAKTDGGLIPLNLADSKSRFDLVKYLFIAHKLKNGKLPANEQRDMFEFFRKEAKLYHAIVHKAVESQNLAPKEDKNAPAIVNTPFANFVNRYQVDLEADAVSKFGKYFKDLDVEYKEGAIEFNLLNLARKIRQQMIKSAGEKVALSLAELQEVISSIKNLSFTNVAHTIFHYIKNKFVPPTTENKVREATVSSSPTPAPVALAPSMTPMANTLPALFTARAKTGVKRDITPKKATIKQEKTAEIQARISERQRNKPKAKPKRSPQSSTAPKSPVISNPQSLEAKSTSPVLSHSLFRKNSIELEDDRMADLILEIDDAVSPLFGALK